MNQVVPLSLEQAEDKITSIILNWPPQIGSVEVVAQRGELAGRIETWAEVGIINEEVRSILCAVYVEGWERYSAIKTFGTTIKIPKKTRKKSQTLENKDTINFPQTPP